MYFRRVALAAHPHDIAVLRNFFSHVQVETAVAKTQDGLRHLYSASSGVAAKDAPKFGVRCVDNASS